MRRLLIVCYFYPPLAGGGVHRVLGFTRHLPAHGWACTVVCAGEQDYWVRDASLEAQVPAETEVVRVGGGSALSALLRLARGGGEGRRSGRAFSGLRSLSDWWLLPDSYAGWSRRAATAAARRIARGGVDAVLTSSPPDSAHLAGVALGRRFGLPWVADFRDPWIGLRFRDPPTAWHRARHAAMERRVLEGADLVLAASRTHADDLAREADAAAGTHRVALRRLEHLPNGFEPGSGGEGAAEPAADADHFTLVFTGTLSLMPETEVLLEALHELFARRPEARRRLRVKLAGPFESGYADRATALGLTGIVEFTGPLPHAETRSLQRRADLLLVWKPRGAGYRTMVPGKLYEYLDTGRPVLGLLDPADEAAELVCRAGGEVVPPGQRASLATAIERRYLAWKDGARTPPMRPEWLADYTRAHLSGRLAGLLDGLLVARGEGGRVTRTASGPITWLERGALAGGLLLAAALMWPLRGYMTDDTFIHLQYARHVADGHGLVFNVGERVYGCTSPLWVALLADAMALGFDGLQAARAIGVAATFASIVLVLQLMRRTVRTPSLRAAATLAWAGNAWMARWSTSGMETPLAVALVLAGFVAFTEGQRWGARPVRTGALWALAALTRPEAAFLLLLWGIFLLIEADGREGLRRLVFGALAPVCVYGGWLVFARLYYGSFWPQTLAAKTAGGAGLAYHAENLWRQARIVGATDGLLVLVLVLGLVFGGRRLWPGRVPAQRLVPWVWVLALPALYAARGVPVISRYLLPLLPILGWLAWRTAERWWVGDAPGPRRLRLAATLAATLAALVLTQNLIVYRSQVLPHVRTFSPALESSLVTWGRWFARHTAPNAVIAAPDIGAIGYFSGRRVVDLAGLVTPQMIPVLARETPEDAVADFSFAAFSRPDYLVDRSPEPYALLARSRYAACLTPLGEARVPNLGLARPEPVAYSFYRVDWAVFDSLHASR